MIWSDGRDLNTSHIRSFPLDPESFPEDLRNKLEELGRELMEDYERNAVIRYNRRRGGYLIKIKEIHPKESKPIIDRIDDVLAKYYGFTEEEREFIKGFDLSFRMGTGD